MEAKQALELFFKDKEIKPKTFMVKHGDTVHMVESSFLQNVIVNHTPPSEQKRIRHIIAQIDFGNGDVNDFLEHLAVAYIKTNF